MIDIRILNAVGVSRTHDPIADYKMFFDAMASAENRKAALSAYEKMAYPFYRFFSNYGTGIGETIEEVIGSKFTDIIPKEIISSGKKKKVKNPIYLEYNKNNNKKPSNYDWLGTHDNNIFSFEVKVIRAAVGKTHGDNKLYEIPSLLEERSLSFSETNRSANGSFQQTKAELFDFLIGVVIYSDQADIYLVPSADIKSGKLKITNQHAGAILEDGSTNEGHLSVRDLDAYKIISVKTEAEFLASDSIGKYIK